MTFPSLPGSARLRLWRQKPFGLLVGHFFRGFFDNEFISAHGDTRVSVGTILVLLAVPGAFICFFLYPKYQDLTSFPPLYFKWPQSLLMTYTLPEIRDMVASADRLFFLSISMIVMGLATVMVWDTLFLDRRDYHALGPLPLSLGALFRAKLSALFLFLVLFGLGVNAFPSVLFPILTSMGEPASLLPLLRSISAHLLSSLAACAFIFLFFVALLGLFLNTLSYRSFRQLSLYLQAVAIVGLLAAFVLMPKLSSSLQMLKRHDSFLLYLVPAVWFLGLYQTLLGSKDVVYHAWAGIALDATATVLLTALGAYLLSYRRYIQRMMETPEIEPAKSRAGDSLPARLAGRLVVRKPLERAVYFFIGKTLMRSQKHQVYFAGWVGLGFALVFEGLVATYSRSKHLDLFQPDAALLSIPLVLSFFILSGMRFVFTLPAELPSNWVFRITESENKEECMAGVRKAMTFLGIVPLFAGLLPIAVYLWGWQAALLQLVFGLTLALILEEALLLNFQKIPFTCSFLPGKSNFTLLGALYLLAFSTYAYSMASLEYWLLRYPILMLAFLGLATPVLWQLMVFRKRRMRAEVKLVFDEQPEPAVQTLGLLS